MLIKLNINYLTDASTLTNGQSPLGAGVAVGKQVLTLVYQFTQYTHCTCIYYTYISTLAGMTTSSFPNIILYISTVL